MAPPVHLCHVFATFAPGGPQVRTCRIANCLGDAFRHTILAIDSNTEALSLLDDSLNIDVVEPERGKGGALYPLHLARKIAALEPDVLLTYNWGSMDAVLGSHLVRIAPHIHAEDGFGPDEAHAQKKRRVWTRRLALRRARAVVAPSRNLERIMREIWHLPERIVRYIANGIDCDRFSPGPGFDARAALGIPESSLVVGTVAHLRGEKNLQKLIRCFASATQQIDAQLLLIGDGPERPALEAAASQTDMTGRIHFLGARFDTPELYRAMDVFALSSATEQMPVSVIEAMATELPILSTDVGDVAQMVAESNARFIVDEGDEAGYVDAIQALAEASSERRVVGKDNRVKCLAEYSEDQMVSTYETLYRESLSG